MPEERIGMESIKALLEKEDLENPEVIKRRAIPDGRIGMTGTPDILPAITKGLNYLDDITLNEKIAKRIDNKLSWDAKELAELEGIPIEEAKDFLVSFSGEGWAKSYNKYKDFYNDSMRLSSDELREKYTADEINKLYEEFSYDFKEDLGVNNIKPVDKEGVKNFIQATFDSFIPDILHDAGLDQTMSPQKKAEVQDKINHYLKVEGVQPIQFNNAKSFGDNLALGLADTLGAMPYYMLAGWATAPLKVAGTFRILKTANAIKNPVLNKLFRIGSKAYEIGLQGIGYSAAEIARRYDSEADVGKLAWTGFKTGVGESLGRMAFSGLLGRMSYIDNPGMSRKVFQKFITTRVGRSLGSGLGEMIEEEGGNIVDAMGEGRLNQLLNMEDMGTFERLAIEFILGSLLGGSYLHGLDIKERTEFEKVVRDQLGMKTPDLKTLRDVIGEDASEKHFYNFYDDLLKQQEDLRGQLKDASADEKEVILNTLQLNHQMTNVLETQAGVGVGKKKRAAKKVGDKIKGDIVEEYSKEQVIQEEGLNELNKIAKTESGKKAIKLVNETIAEIKTKSGKETVTKEDIVAVFNRIENRIETKEELSDFTNAMLQYRKASGNDKKISAFTGQIISLTIKNFLTNKFPKSNALMVSIVDAFKSTDEKALDRVIKDLKENRDPDLRKQLKDANIAQLYNFISQDLKFKENKLWLPKLERLVKLNELKKEFGGKDVKPEGEIELRERTDETIKEPEPVSEPSNTESQEEYIEPKESPEPKEEEVTEPEPTEPMPNEDPFGTLTPEAQLAELEMAIKLGLTTEEANKKDIDRLKKEIEAKSPKRVEKEETPEIKSKEEKPKPKPEVKEEKKVAQKEAVGEETTKEDIKKVTPVTEKVTDVTSKEPTEGEKNILKGGVLGGVDVDEHFRKSEEIDKWIRNLKIGDEVKLIMMGEDTGKRVKIVDVERGDIPSRDQFIYELDGKKNKVNAFKFKDITPEKPVIESEIEEATKTAKEKVPEEVEVNNEVEEAPTSSEVEEHKEIKQVVAKNEKADVDEMRNLDPDKDRDIPEETESESEKQLTESEKEIELARTLLDVRPNHINSINDLTNFIFQETGFVLVHDDIKKEISAFAKDLADGKINVKKAKKYFTEAVLELIGKENRKLIVKNNIKYEESVLKAFARVFVKNKDKKELPHMCIMSEGSSTKIYQNASQSPDGKKISGYDYSSVLDEILEESGIEYYYMKGVFQGSDKNINIDYNLLGAVMNERGYFLLSSNADSDTEIWVKAPKEVNYKKYNKPMAVNMLSVSEVADYFGLSQEEYAKIRDEVATLVDNLKSDKSLYKNKSTQGHLISLGEYSKDNRVLQNRITITRLFENKMRKELSEKANYPFTDANYVKRFQILNSRGMRGQGIKSKAKVVKEYLHFAYKFNENNEIESHYIKPEEISKYEEKGYSVKEANDGIVWVHPDKIKEVRFYFEADTPIIKPFGYFDNIDGSKVMMKCSIQPASPEMVKNMEKDGVDMYVLESADKGVGERSIIGDGKGQFDVDWNNIFIKQFGNEGEEEVTFTRMILNYLEREEADPFIYESISKVNDINQFFHEMRHNTYLTNAVFRLIFGNQNVEDFGSEISLIESGMGIHPSLIRYSGIPSPIKNSIKNNIFDNNLFKFKRKGSLMFLRPDESGEIKQGEAKIADKHKATLKKMAENNEVQMDGNYYLVTANRIPSSRIDNVRVLRIHKDHGFLPEGYGNAIVMNASETVLRQESDYDIDEVMVVFDLSKAQLDTFESHKNELSEINLDKIKQDIADQRMREGREKRVEDVYNHGTIYNIVDRFKRSLFAVGEIQNALSVYKFMRDNNLAVAFNVKKIVSGNKAKTEVTPVFFHSNEKIDESKFDFILKPDKNMKDIQNVSAKYLQAAVDNAKFDILDDMNYSLANLNFMMYSLYADGEQIISEDMVNELDVSLALYNSFYTKNKEEVKGLENYMNPISAFRHLLGATSAGGIEYNDFLNELKMYKDYIVSSGLKLGNSALERIFSQLDPYQLEIHDSNKETGVPRTKRIDLDNARKAHKEAIFKLFNINERTGIFSNVKEKLRGLPIELEKELVYRLASILIKEKESIGVTPINMIKIQQKKGESGAKSFELSGAIRVNEMRKLKEWIGKQSPDHIEKLNFLKDFIGLTYGIRLFVRPNYNFTAQDVAQFIWATMYKRFDKDMIKETSFFKKMIVDKDGKVIQNPSKKEEKINATYKFIQRNIRVTASTNMEGTTQPIFDVLPIHWFVQNKSDMKGSEERSTMEKYVTLYNMEYDKIVNTSSMLKDIDSIKELEALLKDNIDATTNQMLDSLIKYGESVLSLSKSKKIFDVKNLRKFIAIYGFVPPLDLTIALGGLVGMTGSYGLSLAIDKLKQKRIAKKIIEGKMASNKRKISKAKANRLATVLSEIQMHLTEIYGSAENAEKILHEKVTGAIIRINGLPDDKSSWTSTDMDTFIRELEKEATTLNTEKSHRNFNALKPFSEIMRSASPYTRRTFDELLQAQRISAKNAKEFGVLYEAMNEHLKSSLYKDDGDKIIEVYSKLQEELVQTLSELQLAEDTENSKKVDELKEKSKELISKIKEQENVHPEIGKARRFFEAYEEGLFNSVKTIPDEFKDKVYEGLATQLQNLAEKIYRIDNYTYNKHTKALMDDINALRITRARYLDVVKPSKKFNREQSVKEAIEEESQMEPHQIENYVPKFLWNFSADDIMEADDFFAFKSGGNLMTGRDVATKPIQLKYYIKRKDESGNGFLSDVAKKHGLSLPKSIRVGRNLQLDKVFELRALHSINNFEANSMKHSFRELFKQMDKKGAYENIHNELKEIIYRKFFALRTNPIQKELTKMLLEIDNVDIRNYKGKVSYNRWKQGVIEKYLPANTVRWKYIFSNLNQTASAIGTGLMIGGKFSSALVQLGQIMVKQLDPDIALDKRRMTDKRIEKGYPVSNDGTVNIEGKQRNIYNELGKEFDDIIIKGEFANIQTPSELIKGKLIDQKDREEFDTFTEGFQKLLLSITNPTKDFARSFANNMLNKTPVVGQVYAALGKGEKAPEWGSFRNMEIKSRRIVARQIYSDRMAILRHDGVAPEEAHRLAIAFTGKKIDDIMFMFNMLNKPQYLSGNMSSMFLFHQYMVYLGNMAYNSIKSSVRSGMMKDFTLADYKTLMSFGSLSVLMWLLEKYAFASVMRFHPMGVIGSRATDFYKLMEGIYHWGNGNTHKRDKVWEGISYGAGVIGIPNMFFTSIVPEIIMIAEWGLGSLYQNETERRKWEDKTMRTLKYKYGSTIPRFAMSDAPELVRLYKKSSYGLTYNGVKQFNEDALKDFTLRTANLMFQYGVGFNFYTDKSHFILDDMLKKGAKEEHRKIEKKEAQEYWNSKK